MDYSNNKAQSALILSGGGARAAYQIGVLKALSELYPRNANTPFDIICGTSAGAINASAIASGANNFRLAVKRSEQLWSHLSVDNVYRTGGMDILKSVFKLFYSLLRHGQGKQAVAILDNGPLWAFLSKHINFDAIHERIKQGQLKGLSITASSYSNGSSISFFQGHDDIKNWAKGMRYGIREPLSIAHLMASSAIPSILPAVKIGQHYYGDGALRQMSPLSSALHMGATRLMVIGVSNNAMTTQPAFPAEHKTNHTPSLAGILGHVFNSAFIDTLDSDIRHLSRINHLITMLENSDPKASLSKYKKVDLLAINPSIAIDEMAEIYIKNLPRSARLLLNTLGATQQGGGSSMASYLMFDGAFCKELIKIGYKDGIANSDLMQDFFKPNSLA